MNANEQIDASMAKIAKFYQQEKLNAVFVSVAELVADRVSSIVLRQLSQKLEADVKAMFQADMEAMFQGARPMSRDEVMDLINDNTLDRREVLELIHDNSLDRSQVLDYIAEKACYKDEVKDLIEEYGMSEDDVRGIVEDHAMSEDQVREIVEEFNFVDGDDLERELTKKINAGVDLAVDRALDTYAKGDTLRELCLEALDGVSVTLSK